MNALNSRVLAILSLAVLLSACVGISECKAPPQKCGSGQTLCDATCVDLKKDAKNCGLCGNQCNAGEECIGGKCKSASIPSCDDGNPCTIDSRVNGQCVHKDVVCTASDQCHNAGTCDHLTGKCSNPPKEEGTACNDGNACTNPDTCQGGICLPGDPIVCDDDQKPCTLDSCDPAIGCKHIDKICDDGNSCNGHETCNEGTGECEAGSPTNCDDSIQCTIDSCSNGVCTHTPDPTKCNNGNVCDGIETCDPQRGCISGAPAPNCNDNNPCTVDLCDPARGCVHDAAAADRLPCDDGNPCTMGDTCSGGACRKGANKNCDDGDSCTKDSCDQNTGLCTHDPRGNCNPIPVEPCTGCDDHNPCNGKELCGPDNNFECRPGTPPTCDDGNPCTTDYCDPNTVEGCQHTQKICDEMMKECQNGVCVCKPPLTDCGAGGCYDLSMSLMNCGACGNACHAGQSCMSGVCMPPCNPPNHWCGDSCVDPNIDSSNCGSCGNICHGGTTCMSGQCCKITRCSSTGAVEYTCYK